MNNIKKLRKDNNLSQLEFARLFNVHQTAVSQWENDRTKPDIEIAKRMSEHFGVSLDYIHSNSFQSFDSPPQPTKGLWVPVLGRIAAGIPLEAIEDIIDYEEIDHTMASTGVYFGLQIKGDSMAPRIQTGDVVIVRQQQEANSGDIVVAIIDGQDATVKQIKMEQGGIALVPWNPTYEVLRFTCDEVKTIPVTIIGVVYELRGKFLKF